MVQRWNYPSSVIASLMILIFLMLPKHNSSSEHSSCCSIEGGFIRPLELEYMMGVEHFLPLAILESEAAADAPSTLFLRLIIFESEGAAAVWLLLALLDSKTPSTLLLPLMLFDREGAAAVWILLALLDRDKELFECLLEALCLNKLLGDPMGLSLESCTASSSVEFCKYNKWKYTV